MVFYFSVMIKTKVIVLKDDVTLNSFKFDGVVKRGGKTEMKFEFNINVYNYKLSRLQTVV